MKELLEKLTRECLQLPPDVEELLGRARSFTVYNSVEELAAEATGGGDHHTFEVAYDVPGRGPVVEAVVHRVKNGISANYVEPYMRRRDPDTMVIADDRPSDKPIFQQRFGYDFQSLRSETLDWLAGQDLAVFFYFAGRHEIGVGGVAIAPKNAAFFAMGLAMLQQILDVNHLPDHFCIQSAIFIAPPFRHTHFDGKQVVVHCRKEAHHEMWAYNLYPGPSAKKGLYGMLLAKGERENWITAHCAAVRVTSPYDNITTYMHEGASGGGKSEMHQEIVRQPDGLVHLGENTINGDRRTISLPVFCKFTPVTDDMAICHPSFQTENGKLRITDAENAWFIRVDSVKDYGDDPFLERITIKAQKPLLFLNIDTVPDSTALIWEHMEDAPGTPCPNPRVILPRAIVPEVVEEPVSVDVRSFGVRTPACSREAPSYGIIGLFHFLPPALAWLWRLVSPRGHANPSIVDTGGMQSEGVGSYWPFATGQRVDHANMLLEQILATPRVRYTLTPNQHIGVWKVGFKPQLMMREYLTRRGSSRLRPEQYQPARCPLLGFEMNYVTIEGSKIPSRFLKVHRQPEVGEDGYDAGAAILTEFFHRELQKYLTDDLNSVGREIIQVCLDGGGVDDYTRIMPSAFEEVRAPG